MASNGYIKLHRKILDSWQATRPDWAWAWVRMLLKAQFQDCPEKGLLRGQFFSSVRSLSTEFGMTRDGIHRFLSRCEAEGDILWERGLGQTHGQTQSLTHESRFTIVKFDTYQTQSQTHGQTPSVQKKDKKVHTVFSKTVGDNSQIYNLFIESRQNKLGMPEWLPTENQAKIMRSNIKGMLKRHPLKDITSWISRYFDDDKQVNHKWSWTIFFSDPVRWSGDIKSPSAENTKPSDKWLTD